MDKKKFERLINRGFISENGLAEALKESESSDAQIEDVLLNKGVPKHEMLLCLSAHYNLPFVEYDEEIAVSRKVMEKFGRNKLKDALWVPFSISKDTAEAATLRPDDPAIVEDIKKTLGVDNIEFVLALPSDIKRIIENNLDLNPGFQPSGGRTPLARVRTFLAEKRSLMSCQRTSFAKGRTGLALFRTGISFIAVSLVFLRTFGLGYLLIPESLLFMTGIVMAIDGARWYLPCRKVAKKMPDCSSTSASGGSSILEVHNEGGSPVFQRSQKIEWSDALRSGWGNLSPVMRRRFLASDRTDLAEERTTLACYRTLMARARTGLAFGRTGIAFIGLGVALLRQFGFAGAWAIFDIALITSGILMLLEGLYWYPSGRKAGTKGIESVLRSFSDKTIWDSVFPSVHKRGDVHDFYSRHPDLKKSYSPGIWGTTGLALERTVLAERRNVMARLRTVLARSRTGLAFIRTGMGISSVGIGLLAYFGTDSIPWTIFDIAMALTGLAFIADGLYWHLPAEKIKRQFPYCYGDFEITIPDYGKTPGMWKKTVLSHDNN